MSRHTTRTRSTKAPATVALLLLVAALPAVASAQHRAPSAFESVGHDNAMVLASAPALARDLPKLSEQQQAFEPTSSPSAGRVAGGAILGSLGSFGLMYAGALVGWNAGGDEYDGYNFGGLLLGAAAGSVAGSTLGASIVLGNPGKAAMGSIGGGLVGFLMAAGMTHLGHEFAALATYSIVQGTTAALVAGG